MISSDSVSVFDVQINNILNCRKRIGWTNWNDEFDYNGFELQAGDNIKVIATNNSVQSVAEFNVTLIGTTN